MQRAVRTKGHFQERDWRITCVWCNLIEKISQRLAVKDQKHSLECHSKRLYQLPLDIMKQTTFPRSLLCIRLHLFERDIEETEPKNLTNVMEPVKSGVEFEPSSGPGCYSSHNWVELCIAALSQPNLVPELLLVNVICCHIIQLKKLFKTFVHPCNLQD